MGFWILPEEQKRTRIFKGSVWLPNVPEALTSTESQSHSMTQGTVAKPLPAWSSLTQNHMLPLKCQVILNPSPSPQETTFPIGSSACRYPTYVPQRTR